MFRTYLFGQKAFFATFMNISDHAILYLQTLWLVGTSEEKSQIPFNGDLAKTIAVGI